MSILQRSYTALGRLAILAGLAAAFLFGMAGVVYMSLQGTEVKVPEITGKDFSASEKELASLGLKIKKRADRFSTDAPNTILEQLPRSGETVKTGQMILVVVSKSNGETEQAPSTLKPSIEEDDTEKIEKMISDQPKKKSNSNTNKKKTDKTRDVDDNSNSDVNSNSSSTTTEANSAKKPAETPDKENKKNENDKKPATSPNAKPAMKPIIIEVPPRKPTKP
ncbi:MAG TPA: PASTA domain-containing protein [Pyrinomonadaceae bacterium]|nr:PASTA domain-containing protein [Pyrinomonadaceae bacterium]